MRRCLVASTVLCLVILLAACGHGNGRGSAGDPNALAAEAASFDLAVGPPSRFLVGLLTVDHRFIAYGTVQVRFAYLGDHPGSVSYGPIYPARFLPVPGTSLPTPEPPAPKVVPASQARGVYEAPQVAFDRGGAWQAEIAATVDGRPRRTTTAFEVLAHHAVPFVGEPAPRSANLTVSSPGVPPAAIDSRAVSGPIPDPELHQTAIAQAIASHRPAVVVFSTPVFCVSRFCGPVTDMIQQLAHQYRDRAAFIHVEIWKDFQNQQLNDTAAEWLTRNGGDGNEPWVFLIDADGIITARWDNVVSSAEVAARLDTLPRMES